jgi:hypothetical protein
VRLLHRDVEGQQNSPSNGLLFQDGTDPISLRRKNRRSSANVEKPLLALGVKGGCQRGEPGPLHFI